MKKIVFLLMSVLSLHVFANEIDVSISKGAEQSVIASLSPIKAQTNVWNNANVEVRFNVPLDPLTVQKNNVKLVHLSSKTNEHIIGELVYEGTDNRVVFTPASQLEVGVYEVEIKSLKTTKAYKAEQINEVKYRFYVPEVINGYQLPPEPDEKINNSTLLGIDVNHNGIRDDVERKIIVKYIKPIEIELMLSYAKAHQLMLNDPVGSAVESEKNMSNVSDCEMYLMRFNIDIADSIGDIENYTYNTKARVRAYLDFNQALSGGVYGSGPADWNAGACDFDVEQLLENR